ncbi:MULTISPECIES: sensor histidine kinase [unclassified Streptomyces]|uniref:sensor histidine kinase n=1 Tax=unclassified Streptomyces TaxID=2593676 RepID=UPI00036760AC|nr:sensor histidine kinase [Streptomyces sp. BoleA5]MYX35002.1 sensor histidine kinase [Streptomyces sp. SID8377]
MQRLYDFLRRHPTWVDSFWALVLLGFSSLWIANDELHAHSRAAAVPLALALSTVVALRRRMPEKMLLLGILVGVLQLVLDVQANPGDFAMLVIIYTVAANGARWASRMAFAGGLVASTISTLRWPNETDGQWADAVSAVFLAVPFLLAWVIGDSLRTRRAYYAELEERAARLQREREAQSKAAVAAERARIARELHDVVAHNVSVMVVQADGAAYVLDASPEQAKQALETISTTGRQALTEMRRLLGVLRAGDDGGGEYVPQPGVDQLTDLIEQVRGAGLPVAFDVEGESRPLASGVELTAYRIVQEALTNTRKHGGPEAHATVRLTFGDGELSLLIEDDGRGAQQELYEGGGEDGQGQGLIGMRERVGMVSGTLDAGPRPGGGFRISAVLPVKTAR